MALIVRELNDHDDESASRLREYLERDPAPNIYALSGLISKSEGSKFFIAVRGGGEIEGALAIRRGFRRAFIWFATESRESTEALSKVLNSEDASVWVKPEYEAFLEKAIINTTRCKSTGKATFDIMELDREKVKLAVKYKWRRLSESDAYAWAKTEALAEREEEAAATGGRFENVEPSAERVESSQRLLKTLSCFGICDPSEKTILARSAIEELALGTAIRRVFTDPALRGRGYGRSITSVAVQEAMKKRPDARILLFVLQNNRPAKRIYETLGFHTVASRTEFELKVPAV
jgi:GNAT superfamily N-acetyltransferase